MKGQDIIHGYFANGGQPKAVYHAGKSPKFENWLRIMALVCCNPCSPCSELRRRGYITVRDAASG